MYTVVNLKALERRVWGGAFWAVSTEQCTLYDLQIIGRRDCGTMSKGQHAEDATHCRRGHPICGLATTCPACRGRP
jgi:hypothetical protein